MSETRSRSGILTGIEVFRPASMGKAYECFTVRLPAQPTYDELDVIVRPLINGAMERVRVFHNNEYLDMFVHDSGCLLGMPINPRATEIYQQNWKVHRPGVMPPGGWAPICGPAVLFARRVWF